MKKARALTILNEDGDTSIVWTEDRDDIMEETIKLKMAQGVAFFIIEPRFMGLLPPKKTLLEKAEDARKHRALSIRDEDFAKFVDNGHGELVKTPDGPVKGARISRDAKEIAQSESVGVKPRQGG